MLPLRLLWTVVASTLVCTFSGCVSPPVTYKVRSDTAARMREFHRVIIAPPDIEVREISAGGVAEKREDWSILVAEKLTSAVAEKTAFLAASPQPAPPAEELNEVRALARLILINHASNFFAPEQVSSAHRPLTHALGSVSSLTTAWDADAVLLIVARDAYSTAGRKALVALGWAQPAPALVAAMLFDRNGDVQWLNYRFAQNIDLRETAGAQNIVRELLVGLPTR